MIIGAPSARPGGRIQAGSVFVVFGGSKVGGNGMFDLSALNGVNGFRLNGVAASNQLGGSRSAISGLGDVNNDGLNDLIIGAWSASPGNRTKAGSSYVYFNIHKWGETVRWSYIV